MLACSSYCYSEEVFGTTQNAATTGLNWVMTEVLPQQAGLTVNSVIYRYTSVKQTEDDMLVHVQNQNAEAPGFIFRETDDWSGLPGNTINKAIPVANIPIQLWGDGSIEVEGKGEVTNASVLYSFQFDPCFDPQTDPSCPGYVDPFEMLMNEVSAKDPLDDDLLQAELRRKSNLDAQEEDENERQRRRMKSEDKGDDDRLEAIMGIVNTSLLAAEAAAKHAELAALNSIPQTYFAVIPDTKYEETVVLKDGRLPENKRARRVGFAQQLLHEKMVDLQYNNKENK